MKNGLPSVLKAGMGNWVWKKNLNRIIKKKFVIHENKEYIMIM